MPTGKFEPKPVTGPNGEKWAGRGRKPKWLKEQENATATTASTTDAPQAQAGQAQEAE
jgi:DNA-binding protein H-NS